MALDGDEDRDDQARSKAMLETAFQSEGLTRIYPFIHTLNVVVASIFRLHLYLYACVYSYVFMFTEKKELVRLVGYPV
jgi:hypothetical protein